MKLKVAAQIDRQDEHFKQDIEPLVDTATDWVEFIGEVGGREKDGFLGNAHALLFPIDCPEPFSLVMIESLACGAGHWMAQWFSAGGDRQWAYWIHRRKC